MMYSTGYNMDGDEYTFIDGSRTPQMHGDGTEDDHNQGWGGYAIQKPYWGGLVNGFQGGYRLYIAEPYVFDSSIDIFYEHSNCGPAKDRGQKTDFTVWYYLDTPGAVQPETDRRVRRRQAAKARRPISIASPAKNGPAQPPVRTTAWSTSPRDADDDRRRPRICRHAASSR